MLSLFELLRHCALVIGVLGARLVEASAEGLNESASSLAAQLSAHLEAIATQPCAKDNFLRASQELVDKLKATLNLITDRFFEFVEDYDVLQPMLESTLRRWPVSSSNEPMTKIYARRYQDPNFLQTLALSYSHALENLMLIAADLPWHEDGFESLGALPKFLRSYTEALRVNCEAHVYSESIFATNPSEMGQGEVEETKRIVCADYEALTHKMVNVFEEMAETLKEILLLPGFESGMGYQKLAELLNYSLISLFFDSPIQMNDRTASFKSHNNNWVGPSEALASVQIQVIWKILELRLKFPGLNHVKRGLSGFFPKDDFFQTSLDEGVLLISREAISLGGTVKDPEKCLADVAKRVEYFAIQAGRWAYTLFQSLLAGDAHLESHKKAKKWLSQIEANLCLLLGAIEASEEQKGRLIVAVSLGGLGMIAVNIERMLSMPWLYEPGQLERREGEPGHFLIKLRQVVGGVCPFAKPLR